MVVNVVKLGDFVKIQTGKLDANAADENGLYPFFTCAVEPLAINTYAYDCECILIAGNGDLNVKYYNGKFNAYQRTYIIEVTDKTLDIRYLYHFLTKYINVLRQNSIGGVIKYIKLGDLTGIKLPLPTIEEQEKIVSILDKADEIRAKKKLANDKLDEFLKSSFISMFGDPVKNEKKWLKSCLGDVCDLITDGTHKTPQYKNSGIKFISAKNVKNAHIDLSDTKFISEEEHLALTSRCKPEFEDIVLTKSGSIGSSAIIDFVEPVSLFESLALIKYCRNKLNGRYLNNLLNGESIKNTYINNIKGISIKHLHLNEIKKISIIMPPIEQQNKFAKIVEHVEAQKQKNEEVIEQMDNLFNSLSQRAFKGEI